MIAFTLGVLIGALATVAILGAWLAVALARVGDDL